MNEERIIVALESAQQELRLLRSDIRETRTTVDHRIRGYRRLMWAFIILTILSGYNSYASRVASKDAQAALGALQDQRVEALRTTCDQANRFIVAHNGLVEEDKATLEQAKVEVLNSNLPEDQKRVAITFYDSRITSYNTNIVELRDCVQEVKDFIKPLEGN
jgi:hypothetical protein